MSNYISTSDAIVASFSRMLGGTNVSESGDVITISKFPGREVALEISRVWGTTTIVKYMFNDISYFRLSFYKFFAVEVDYIFRRLLKESRLHPGTKGFIKEALVQLHQNTWLNQTQVDHTPRLNKKHLNKFKKDPMPSQLDFMERYDSMKQKYMMNGYLLSAPPGSGKTLINLYLSECLEKDITIIFCPKIALNDPWVKTLETEFYDTPTYWVSGGKDKLDNVNYRYLIVHYEAINQLFPFVKELRKKNVMICLDECHNFNDIKADRTNNFVNLCLDLQCEDVLPGSGTPVKAISSEMIPFLKSADPFFTDAVETRFKKIFGVSKARANDIMAHRMGIITHKIEKSEVVQNKIEEIDYKVSFAGSDKYTLPVLKKEMMQFILDRLEYYKNHKALYEERYQRGLDVFKKTLKSNDDFKHFAEYLEDVKKIQATRDYSSVNDVIARCNRYEKKVIHPALSGKILHEFKDAKSVIKYVSLKVRGEALGRILGKRRAECHVDMINHAQLEAFVEDAVKKTIIFTSYVDVVKGITDYFKNLPTKRRYDPLPVYTDTSSELKRMTKRFEEEERANPMVATYQTLSTAVPLTMASTAIFFNQPFRSYEKEQAGARIDRKGQDSPLTFVNIILDTGEVPNISTRSMDIMQWSKEQVEQITGIKTGSDNLSLESHESAALTGDVIDNFLDTYDLGMGDLTAAIVVDESEGSVGNQFATRFYNEIAEVLKHAGIDTVILCDCNPHNLPIDADIYVGCGTGNAAFGMLDAEQQQCFVQLNTDGGINHPDVESWLLKQSTKPDLAPAPRGHYVLTGEQKTAIKGIIAMARDKRFGLEYFEIEQDIHHRYDVLSSHVASIESMSDTDIVALTPGIEGLFDGAKRLVNKLFGVNIDKGKVKHYTTSWRINRVVNKMDYAQLSDVMVMRPEGMRVTYLAYAIAMQKQFSDLNEFLSIALDSCSTYLAQLASNPGQIGSITSSEFNLYLKQYNLAQKKKEYAALFSASNTASAPYHEVVANNKEWSKLDSAIEEAHVAYNKISPTEVEEKVERIYDILEDIVARLKTDRESIKLSKVQIKDLSMMAYSVASVIEFYSVLMFGWNVYNQSLAETEKTLADWTPSSEGTESFSDVIKSVINFIRSKPASSSSKDDDVAGDKYLNALKKANDLTRTKFNPVSGNVIVTGDGSKAFVGGNTTLSKAVASLIAEFKELDKVQSQIKTANRPFEERIYKLQKALDKNHPDAASVAKTLREHGLPLMNYPNAVKDAPKLSVSVNKSHSVSVSAVTVNDISGLQRFIQDVILYQSKNHGLFTPVIDPSDPPIRWFYDDKELNDSEIAKIIGHYSNDDSDTNYKLAKQTEEALDDLIVIAVSLLEKVISVK